MKVVRAMLVAFTALLMAAPTVAQTGYPDRPVRIIVGFMFTHQRPLIRFEILAIISICGLLFVVAFREAGHPLWAIPAMTLFLLSGMMFVYALSKASRRLLQGPQETTLAVP